MRLLTRTAAAAMLAVLATMGQGPAVAATRSEPIYTQSVVEIAHVPMRDGETLYVQFMRPVTPSRVRVPVILTLSPYNIFGQAEPGGARYSFDSYADFYVPRGYARAIADVRGIGESTGCWDYGGVQERGDGYDLVEWLARRPWSNSRVAMIGGSYDGTTAVMTAGERPPHLATIVPYSSIDRWYDYAYINGVRWLGNSENATDEGFDTPLAFDFGFAVPPPVGVQGERWRNALEDRVRPCERVEHTLRGYDTQPDYDSFWRDRDYRISASRVRTPALIAHGLDDYNVKVAGSLALYRAYRGPKRLVLGQWPHAGPSSTATGPWSALLHRWFDKWLLGIETRVMRELPVHSQDSTGTWRTSRAWPPERTRPATLYPDVRGAGSLGPLGLVAGTLEPRPGPPQTGAFVDDPTLTENIMRSGSGAPSFLRFYGSPQPSAIRISGEPRLTVTLTSSEPGTHVAAYLASAAPDGTWTRISRGFLNTRYRDGLERAKEMPADPVRMSFALTPADQIVPAGHRIALAISSSNAIWAVPDEGRAYNIMYSGRGSSLVVPIGPR